MDNPKQVLINRVTVHMGTRSKISGNPKTYRELVSTSHEGVSKGIAGLERRMSYSYLNATIGSTRVARRLGI